MKNVIILHGIPDTNESFVLPTWINWLKQNLSLKTISAEIPELSNLQKPNYSEWRLVFEQFKINDETILIGHSAGGGFIIRYLAENNISVDKVILVAPWLDPDKYLQTMGCEEFFDFEFNSNVASKILNQVNSIDVLYSTDDDEYILQTIEIIKQNFNTNHGDNNTKINYHEFTNRGHFTTEPGYNNDTLLEVLDICLMT